MKLDDLTTGTTGLIGFGREGRALEAALRMHDMDARVEVIAEQSPEIRPECWPLRVQALDGTRLDYDRILRSPGVPVDHPALMAARRRGIEVTTTSSLWFARRPEARTIAVTGSKGKSTTSALIAHLLRAAGHSVALAGNIGIPLIGLLDHEADWFVIELSSYQLVDLQADLDIGVITRLFPEHVDWHGSLEKYYAAKLRMLDLLRGGPLWINAVDPVLTQAVGEYPGLQLANTSAGIEARADGIYRAGKRLLAGHEWPLVGRHNLDNLAVALSVVASLGLDPAESALSVRDFEGLPHRLQRFSDRAGRYWINDSISTTPFATQAALSCCASDVVLIVGGLERDADWRTLIEQHRQKNRPELTGLVALPNNGSRIIGELVAAGLVPADRAILVGDMPAAVRAARGLAGPQSEVLLSPGAPSFPHYRDFEDRGHQFVAAVDADD